MSGTTPPSVLSAPAADPGVREDPLSPPFDLVQLLPEPALLTAFDTGDILAVNDAFLAVTGYAREDVIGQTTLTIDLWASAADRDRAMAYLAQDGKIANLRADFRRKDGGLLHYGLSAARLTVNDRDCVLSVAMGRQEDARLMGALRESSEQGRLLAENSQNCVCELDSEGRRRYVNQKGRACLGIAPEGATSASFFDAVHAGDVAETRRNFARALERLGQTKAEFRMRRRDGWRWVKTVAGAYATAEGKKRLVAVARDVTERRRAEEELRKGRQRLADLLSWKESILNNPALGILVVTKDRIITEINSGFTEMFGYRPEELVGRSVDVIHVSDEHSEDFGKRYWSQTAVRQSVIVQWRFRRKNGETFWCELTGSAMNRQDIWQGVVWSLVDISERKRAEMTLLREKSFTEAVLNSVPGLLYVYDDQGRLVRWNKKHEELTGYSAEELAGMRLGDWYAGDAETLAKVEQAVGRVFTEGIASVEADLRNKDGSATRYYFTGVLLIIDGRTYFTGIGIDVTELKRTEEALRQSLSMLDHVVNSVPQAIFWKDRDSVYLGCNTVFANSFGFDSPRDLVGKSDYDLPVPLSEAEAYRADDREVMRDGRPKLHFIEPVQRADGSRLWADTSKVPLTASNGESYGVLGVFEDITARKRSEEELIRSRDLLAENQVKLSLALDLAKLGPWERDVASGTFLFNDRFYALYGTSAEREGGCLMDAETYVREFLPPEDGTSVAEAIKEVVPSKEPQNVKQLEHRIIRRDGAVRDVVVRYCVINDAAGNPVRASGVNQDITEWNRTVNALRESETRYRLLAETCHDFICELDELRRYVFVNGCYEDHLGYAPDELLGRSPLEFIHPDDLPMVASLLARTHEHGRRTAIEFRFRKKNGEWVWGESMANVYKNLDGQWRTVVVSRNVTERKAAEQMLAFQAFHDCLTGLPNRSLLLDRLDQALKAAETDLSYRFAVLFLDLDRFKIINDSLGHVSGDEVLKTVGQALRECVRESDTVARLGGDEFAVILENLPTHREVIRAVKRIRSRISRRISVGGFDLLVSASIGIVLSPKGGKPEDLLRNADIAMYLAKRKGPGRLRVFTPRMHDQAVRVLRLEHDLRRAIEREELEVRYQPIMEIETGRLHGVEALARWLHPELGPIAPSEFIALAEETGLILPLGRLVLTQACRHGGRWNAMLPRQEALSIHVNLSPKQFSDGGLSGEVERVLAQHALPARLLNLEITETALMETENDPAGILRRLKALGIGLSLDDFGTGYSSLGNLYKFPVDTLKIDRSFVNRLDRDRKTAEMVRMIVALAKVLEKSVIAEGVESQAQADRLKSLGCGHAQGYFFSRALDVRAMDELVIAAALRLERPA